MFETLSCFGDLETAQVNMYNIHDKYCYPPYFRFRFANKSKDDVLYMIISDTVNNYDGKIQWTISTNESHRNFIIIPLLFEKYLYTDYPFRQEYIFKDFDDNDYYRIIDDALEDIPNLARAVFDSCNKD